MKTNNPSRSLFKLVFVIVSLISILPAYAYSVRTTKHDYAPDEPIEVIFSGFSTNYQDWINVVKSSDTPDVFGDYKYTKGKTRGSFTFKGLKRGSYEVRAYCCWPRGEYKIKARQAFTVEGGGKVGAVGNQIVTLKTRKDVYAPDERIVVEYSVNNPHERDWVTVVKSGTPMKKYAEYKSTKGKTAGEFTFKGLPAGTYEARFYCCWRYDQYNFVDRHVFTVK